MDPITLKDIAATETGLISENREGLLGEGLVTTESQLRESIGVENTSIDTSRSHELLREASPGGAQLEENLANFGGKQAKGFTSTDNDGKPGTDPEHLKGGAKSCNKDCDCKECKKKGKGKKEETELDEATNIGLAVLKKFKSGDKVKIEAPWLKKPRLLTVTGNVSEYTSPQSGEKHYSLPVVSGHVRPGHRAGGLVMYNYWGENELSFQPTIQQQLKKITRINRVSANEGLDGLALDDLLEGKGRRSASTASVRQAVKDASGSMRDMASRLDNAEDGFIKYAMEHGKMTRKQAEKVLRVYRKEKLIKLSPRDGQWNIKHGAFLDPEVLKRAANYKEGTEFDIADGMLEDTDELAEAIDAKTEAAFKEFMRYAQGLLTDRYKKNLDLKPSLEFSKGKKWWRLFFHHKGAQGRTAYGFFDPATGDLLKADGWKRPAANFPRGNVLDKSTWRRGGAPSYWDISIT